jgi:hypothetical protein
MTEVTQAKVKVTQLGKCPYVALTTSFIEIFIEFSEMPGHASHVEQYVLVEPQLSTI